MKDISRKKYDKISGRIKCGISIDKQYIKYMVYLFILYFTKLYYERRRII